MKKILFALLFMTMAFSQVTEGFDYMGWYNSQFYAPGQAMLGDLIVVDESTLGAEVLDERDFATNFIWTDTNDMDASGGTAAVFTWSANQTSTLTHADGDFLTAINANMFYAFTYTVAVTTAFDGDGAATITTDIATVAESLPLTAGTHTVYFLSAAIPTDFVISIVSGTDTEGTFSIDDVTLKQIEGGDAAIFGDLAVA